MWWQYKFAGTLQGPTTLPAPKKVQNHCRFPENRCILQADRVVRPYRVRGIENFFVGADDSVGLLRSYEFV